MRLPPTRLLVGLAGLEADAALIRYAAMLARLAPAPEHTDAAVEQAARHGANVEQRAAACATITAAQAVEAGSVPEVRFVHVQPRVRAVAPDRLRRQLREQVLKYFPALPLPIGCDILRGRPAPRLAEFAADFDCDLLLVGQACCPPASCGRLAMTAPCPVWFVPGDWPPLVRRILVPIDLAARDRTALRTAVGLARRFARAKVLPLHVHGDVAAVADETIYRRIQGRKLADLRAFVAGVPAAGVAVEPLLAAGMHVADVIADVAHRQSVDLIILSSRGRTRLASLVLPSVVDHTLRLAPVSILVLKEAGSPLGFFPAAVEKLRASDTLRFN